MDSAGILLLVFLFAIAYRGGASGDNTDARENTLILTSRESHTVAILDIEGLATFDALDALYDYQSRSRGRASADGSNDGRKIMGPSSGGGSSSSSSSSIHGLATRNGNFSELPFNVHAVNGLDELTIERGPSLA